MAKEQTVRETLYTHVQQNLLATCTLATVAVFLLGLLVVLICLIRQQQKQQRMFMENQSSSQLFAEIMNRTGFDFFQLSLNLRRLDTPQTKTHLWKFDSLNTALTPENGFLEEDASHFREQLAAVTSGQETSCEMNFRIIRKGITHYYAFFCMRQYSKVYRQDIIVGYVQNRTEQKLRQNYQLDRETLLETSLLLAPTLVVVKNVDDDFRIVECNSRYLSWINLPRESIVGRREWELLPQSEFERIHQADLNAVKNENSQPEEMALANTSGKDCIIRLFHRVYRNSEGKRMLLCIGEDITDETSARQKAEDNQFYLDAILAAQPDVVTLKDINNKFRYSDCNAAMSRICGRTKDCIIGRNDAELFPDDDFYTQVLADLDAIKKDSPVYSTVDVHDNSDGKRTFYVQRSRIKRGGQEFLLSIGQDITELVDLRRELQKTRRILETVMDKIPVWIAVKDMEDQFRYLLWNHKAEELTGIPASEIIGKTDFDIPILTREAQTFRENSRRAESGGGYHHVRQYDWTTPDGRSVLLEGHLTHLEFGDQKLEVAMCYDITAIRERNTAEQEKLLLIDSFEMPVMLFNSRHQLLHANPAARKAAGMPLEKMLKTPCHSIFCRNSNYPENCPVEQALANRKTHSLSLRLGGNDYIWIATPIFSGDNLRYVLCWLLDITEFVAKQQELSRAVEMERNASTNTFSFLSSLIFWLRGSMSNMVGAAELLIGGRENDTHNGEEFDSIKIAENQILSLLDNTEEFIKLKTGRFRDETVTLLPGLFFNELKKSVPPVINFDCADAPMPGLRLNTKALRGVLLNWIIGIGTEVPQLRLEASFSGGNRLEFHLSAAGAARVLQKKAKEPGFLLADLFVEKLHGKIIKNENSVTLVIEPVERI